MKKTLLFMAMVSSLVLANQNAEATHQEIQDAQAQIKALQNKIKKLKSSLEEDELLTHTEFGYLKTQGNTETQDMNLEATITKKWNKHEASIHIEGQYAEDGGVESKNKIFTELGYNYAFARKVSSTYIAGYKNDKFSDYDYQFYTGPGLKYHILKDDIQKLDL